MEGKERILTELKSRVGDPSVASKFSNLTERTLTEYVDKLYPSLGEGFEPSDSFYGTHVGILETMAGNIRFAASSAVEDYKKNNPAPKTPVEPKPKDGDESVPKWAESLLAKVTQFEENQTKAEEQAVLNRNISEAKEKLKSSGADNDAVLDIVFGLVEWSGDESVDDMIVKAKVEYDKKYSALYGNGYSPQSSSGGSQPSNFAAYKAQKQKEGKLPS